MQHSQARFFPQIGHDIPVVHVSWNDEHGRSQSGQSNSRRAGRLPVAGIVQIAAKDNEICINILQPVQHLDAVMQIRQP